MCDDMITQRSHNACFLVTIEMTKVLSIFILQAFRSLLP